MVTDKGAPRGDHAVGPEILSSVGDYNGAWLSDGPKLVVPVPAGSHVDDALVRRITEGCRAGEQTVHWR